MSAILDGVLIRELDNFAEYKVCEQFQRDVWGEDDPADNADLLQAIAHCGGLVAAAFQRHDMVGLVFAFPTDNPAIQHSHRLAVRPDIQGSGLGQRLKWFQRDWCLQRDITTVKWTYDPLRRANATLNIARLGAVARQYHENYYGEMAGINAGIPSDRIVAHWSLSSSRVARLADRHQHSERTSLATQHVSIPSDLDTLLRDDPVHALAERTRVRGELQDAFNKGLSITGFEPENSRYCLTMNGTNATAWD